MKKSLVPVHELKNNFFILAIIWRVAPSRIIWSLVINIIENASRVFIAVFLFRLVLNGIQSGKPIWDVLGVVGIQFLLSGSAHILSTIYQSRIIPITDQLIYQHINSMLYTKAVSVELACFENKEFFDNYTKAAMEANTRATEVLDNTVKLIMSFFSIFTVIGVLATLDTYVALFSVFPFIGNLIVTKRLNKLRYDWDMENVTPNRQKEYVKRTVYLQNYAKEIRLNPGITSVLTNIFSDAIARIIGISRKYGKKAALYEVLIGLLNMVIPFMGASIYSVYRIMYTKTMLVGDYAVIAIGVINLAFMILSCINMVNSVYKNSLYIDNLRSFLNYEPKINENLNGLPEPDGVPDILVQNLSFQYDSSAEPTLKNLNLHVQPREKIAIVGHNGAGKTTLVKLLLRLYDATDGEIILNGNNIKVYNLKKYRSLFGTVFQDYRLFSVSVSENILTRCVSGADSHIVNDALRAAGIYEKVSSLENGISTIVTREFDDKGAVLSGGEQQKIALARVYAQSAPIVLLDEPSSALDPIAEHEMFESMLEITKDKTVIYISHRMSGAVLADRVLFMEHGEIAEMGTHSALMLQNGKYAEMFNKQAEAYRYSETKGAASI